MSEVSDILAELRTYIEEWKEKRVDEIKKEAVFLKSMHTPSKAVANLSSLTAAAEVTEILEKLEKL